MKKFLKQLICFILILCIGAGSLLFCISELKVSAEEYSGICGTGAKWSLDSGVLTVSGSGTTGNYQAVSGINAPWYKHKDEILYIEVREGITSIGSGSFRDCGNVLDVSLPESLKEISEMSFSGCNKLQTIVIPANVNKIDASAFLECMVLEKVTVDAGNNYYCSDNDGVLFNKAKTKLVLFPEGKITTEYSIPYGVTEIGEYAFANCSELININIPASVNTIGINAFYNCRTLLSADIPEGVTSIKSNTFYGCSALYEVKLPSTVTVIGSNAFGKCGSLMKINIPNATKSIDASAFSSSPNLKVYCDKDSEAHKFCMANSIDFHYSNIASLYPMPASVIYGGHTYGRFDTACTWEEAKLVCEMVGGHLVTITSQAENDVVKSLITGGNYAYWIGGNDLKSEGTWEWVTGEGFGYTNWKANNPDDWQGVEEYAEMLETGLWNDNSLGAGERGFVCEYEDFYIPDQTITYNGHIYSLYNESIPWTEAKAFCESIGGHLVTISDQAEQDAINSLFYLPKKWLYWIGFYDSNLDGIWEWVTGESVAYTNWNTGEPNGATTTTHTYAHIYSIQSGSNIKGCWNDEYNEGNGTADYRLANTGFICEIEPENFVPSASGYYNGNRYEVYKQKVTWTDAQWYAQINGSHLVSIVNSSEESFINKLFSEIGYNNGRLWIGGLRERNDSDFIWVNGERFVYKNWTTGEPNNTNNVEPFIEIYRINEWNDNKNFGSADSNAFIVEYESPKQVLTLSAPDGTVLNRYKVRGGLAVDEPLKDYKPGYTAEWYKEPSLQNKWNFETDVITEDTTLYAKFTPKTCVVDFEPNGGECSTDSKSVTFGTSYGNLPTPTKVGYTFAGWYADEAFTSAVKNVTAVSIAENHTLYAKWKAKTYTVSFDGNGGTLNVSTKTVVFGEPYGELPVCSRAGSDFLGWYSDPDCSELVDKNSTVTIAQNHTLYAGWNESAVTSLNLITKPTKTEYYVGDSLDTTGLSIQATFANGSTGEMPTDKMTYSITEFISSGKKIVKASYGGKYVSFIVNVSNRVLTSVSIATLPDKLTYTVGDTLDTTGLVVTAVYDNSSTKTVTEGFTATCDMSSAGTKTVTVNYTENGVTVSTSYQITVNPKVTEPDAVISVDSVSATAGETISVPFRIENNKGFMGFAITVDYDSDAFTPVSVSPAVMLENGTLNDSIGSAYEYLKIVYVGSDDITGDGELFTVDFVVNENASGKYSFDVSYLQSDTFNESLDDVVFKCNDFDVTVSNSAFEQSVVFAGGSVDADAGTTVSVPVSVENGIGINSFSFKISCNNEVMSFGGVSHGDIINGTVNASVNESSDEILLNWSGSPLSSDGTLFYVTFEIEDDVQSYEILNISCENITFSNGIPKNVICIDAEVNVINPDGGDTPVIYSKNYLRIEDSIIEVPVYIKNNHGIMGFGVNFDYDSSIITPLSVTKGEMLSDGYFVDNIGSKDGSFKVLWNNSKNISLNGELFTLKFSVAEGAKPESVPLSIAYSQPDTYNENWEDVALNINIPEICISYIYTATFMHNGEVIGTDEFFPDDDSLNYPVMPEKPHYEWVWYEHEIKAEDITVEGKYLPVEYTISYYNGNALVATDKYTVETISDEIVLPQVPEKTGYTGKWNDFTLGTEDITVYCSYTPIVYTATFMYDGEVIGTDEFTIEDDSLDYPETENKEHYEWVWDEYIISASDLTVEGRYIPIEYTINFVSGGQTVKTQKYTVETMDSLSAPEVSLPAKEGYYSEWESWEGKTGNLTVNEVYVAIEYTISFLCDGQIISQDKFTVETKEEEIKLPEIPEKTGYTGQWNEFVIAAKDIEVKCMYVPVVYTATFISDGKVIGTDTFTVEDDALDYPYITKYAYYDWVWDEHKIEAKNITVEGRYVPITYTITFVSSGKVLKTQEYNINTVDSIVAPAKLLPAKQHYTTAWEDWTGKVGNITVNEIYVPIKYKISFYCQNELVATRSYTIETSESQIILPAVPKVNGYDVKWPELKFAYKDQSIYATCTTIVYTAQFVAEGVVVDTQTFTVETEKLNEPAVPQKAGYIAAWSGYVLEAKNIIIYAKYYPPEVVMKAKVTMKVDETTRLLTSCNFNATKKTWSSSNPEVATVDNHGNVTAVGKGECKIYVTCYGEDSFGNDIKATNKTEIAVNEQVDFETFKARFREAFDEFFEVKLHDFLENLKRFMIVLLRYAY